MQKDIGVEDETSLAMVRIDGKPQQGIWIEPGYLASPSSKKAQEQYHKYFDKWTGMGANTFFTNVIGAITSYTHRYDFHPDAESPDDMYDAIAKQFKWYSDRNRYLQKLVRQFEYHTLRDLCIMHVGDWITRHLWMDI